jgi:hypothetical protein
VRLGSLESMYVCELVTCLTVLTRTKMLPLPLPYLDIIRSTYAPLPSLQPQLSKVGSILDGYDVPGVVPAFD